MATHKRSAEGKRRRNKMRRFRRNRETYGGISPFQTPRAENVTLEFLRSRPTRSKAWMFLAIKYGADWQNLPPVVNDYVEAMFSKVRIPTKGLRPSVLQDRALRDLPRKKGFIEFPWHVTKGMAKTLVRRATQRSYFF